MPSKTGSLAGHAPVRRIPVMCSECGKQCRGWWRAFTPTEAVLTILQAVLLVWFFVCLAFLILHFLNCSSEELNPLDVDVVTSDSVNRDPTDNIQPSTASSSALECTWTPSDKTAAGTQYFEPDETADTRTSPPSTANPADGVSVPDQLDGVLADREKSYVMALVKVGPLADITFGCILTVVSEFWTLTAASCIESVEEEDTMDSFVVMEKFGEPRHGRTHAVSTVGIHPLYQGANRSYDIAALKSHDRLTSGDKMPKLPTAIDYFSIAIGERLSILGFGKFRSKDEGPFARSVREVWVHAAAGGACAGAGLCAGVLRARERPCSYCAGTPLLRAGTLLGLMSAGAQCGADCAPALYVNLAAVADWLTSVLRED